MSSTLFSKVTKSMLDVLNALVLAGEEGTYRPDVTAKTGLGQATTHRILQRFTDCGWVTVEWADGNRNNRNRPLYRLVNVADAMELLRKHRRVQPKPHLYAIESDNEVTEIVAYNPAQGADVTVKIVGFAPRKLTVIIPEQDS